MPSALTMLTSKLKAPTTPPVVVQVSVKEADAARK
jgi:hypothetical protein